MFPKTLPIAAALCAFGMSIPFLQAASSGPATLPPLRTDGVFIVDSDGNRVNLRGVNLGGWLLEEIWMLPFEDKPPQGTDFEEITCHTTLWRTIEKRFGQADMLRIRKAWRENWITKADFQNIKNAGFNCVRLPFLYDSLNAPDGLYPWIDQALVWAREVGIYVIIDLHGAPGRQSGEHHTGHRGQDRMFKDPAMVEKTVEVWKQVAARYKDYPEVAAFDLLNEPTGTPNEGTLYLVYDRLYRAVRPIAPEKILIIDDAYRGIKGMPIPKIVGWENVALSQHEYLFNAKSTEHHGENLESMMKKLLEGRALRDAPIYVGEFNIEPHSSAEMMRKFMDTFDANGISWTIWTYKTAMRGGGGGMWGWFRSPKEIQTINPYKDSLDEILNKIAQIRTENLEESAIADALRLPPVKDVAKHP